MPRLRPIRTPFSQQWRQIRYQMLPVFAFIGALAGTGWLWDRHVRWPDAIGEVEAVRVQIVSLADGLSVSDGSRRWELLDRVKAGQIIARLDDRAALAGLDALQAELVQVRAQLVLVEQEFGLDRHDRMLESMVEEHRRIVEYMRTRLDVLDRVTILESDRIELQRLSERLEILENLFARDAAAALEILDARLRHDVVRERVQRNEVALEEARAQRTAADERQGELVALPDPELGRALAPIRAAIEAQEARVREAHWQIETLVLRTPVDGTIVAIHRWPGSGVRAGDPVLTIAADDSRYIVGYIREGQRFRPAVGMDAVVRSVSAPGLSATTRIQRVGPQVEPIPQHQLRDPNRPEWGLPFRMVIPPELNLLPGELVNVTFNPVVDGEAG